MSKKEEEEEEEREHFRFSRFAFWQGTQGYRFMREGR
jgi:hypothetical protein